MLWRIGAGENTREGPGKNWLYAKEAAANDSEIHFDHHQSPHCTCVPFGLWSAGIVEHGMSLTHFVDGVV